MSGETFTDITVQGTANHNALLVTGTTTLTDLYITGLISYAIPPISTTHNILTVLTTNANAQSLVSNTPTTLLWSTVPAVPTYPPENVLGIPNLTYNPSTGHFSNTGTIDMILMLQATVVFCAPGGGSSGFRTISFAQTSAAIVGGTQQVYLSVPAPVAIATMATIELGPGDDLYVQAETTTSTTISCPPASSTNILTITQL